MTDPRSIAYDATFMVLYIGLLAANSVLSVALLTLLAFGIEFGEHHVGAMMLNLLGWAVLPFAPRLYRRLMGRPFSWRSNGALGGEI